MENLINQECEDATKSMIVAMVNNGMNPELAVRYIVNYMDVPCSL